MPIVPGAEDYSADGGDVAVLFLHGFTGSPWSLRPWAEHHAAAGLTVRLPRLPGHGTTWQELNRTRWQDWYAVAERALADLRASGRTVVIACLSAGGALAARLAETHPGDVAGIVAVNPAVSAEDPRLRALPALRWVVPSLAGISNDIARPGADERAYTRTPLHALWSLTRLWQVVRADLNLVACPLLIMRSTVDNVVPASSTTTLVRGVSSTDVVVVELSNSRHVATLDHDADLIMARSLEFVRRITAASAPEPAPGPST